MENRLNELRQSIDSVDNQLIELLNSRMEHVREIGELKKANNAIIYRPEREKAIIDRLHAKTKGLLNRSAIEAIFLEIFAVSRNLELPERVVYLGPEGSFTHQAAESRFGAMSEYVPLSTIQAVFESIDTGRARFGVVPLENNQQGTVNETLDLLESTDVHIVAEVPMDIQFAFASTHERLSDIKKVYSKDIAFGQCAKFLLETYGEEGVRKVPVASTSRAARLAAEEPGSAAICSPIAAKLYNLPVLVANIENSSDNQTRFLIISKDFRNQRSNNDKTSVLAYLSDEPGSLAGFLQDFHTAGINLAKVESRPSKQGKGFKYWFFVEFDGHYQDDAVEGIIAKYGERVRWLGSYVKLC